MNRKLRQKLKLAYRYPGPRRKEHFLQNLNYPTTTYYQFILNQIGYIKLRTWILSVIILGFIILYTTNVFYAGGLSIVSTDIIKITSAFMPFLAINTITELIRSRQHCMDELEMTTKYSLGKIMLVRMFILCIGNLIVLCVSLPFVIQKTGIGLFRVGIYMLVPYFATVSFTLWIMNHINSREIKYSCAASGIFVSCLIIIFGSIKEAIYEERNITLWMVLFVIFIILTVYELYKMMKGTEELIWN